MRTRHLRDGDNVLIVPDGVGLRFGDIDTLPTAAERYEGEVRRKDGLLYACVLTAPSTWAWEAIATGADGDFAAIGHDHDAAYQPLDADLTAIAALADPNADRGLFWDDSAGTWKHLTFGTGLAVSDVTLNADVPGLVFIAGATFSGSSAVNVDDCFSATYENYLIVVAPYASSGAANLDLRLRASGTDHATTYYYGLSNVSSAAAESLAGAANTTGYRIISTGTAITEARADLYLGQPFVANETAISHVLAFRNATPVSVGGHGGGFHNQATSYDGFSLIPSTGTITGTYRVYGYRNS